MGQNETRTARWTFLTNHAHVLLCLARSPALRLRDVAVLVGVTERAVQRIIADLEGAGYLTRRRDGRRNQYEIAQDQPLRHAVEAHQTVRALIGLGARSARRVATTATPPVRPAGAPGPSRRASRG
ncbi:MarR family transcriptional regulator [Luteitalea sp.]|uniref:helix-turn-helix transcriptional regulator n=1 Tax=Luteitalea sp. TaxID=2004800 RepID=UPI0025C29D2F|nr:MarR family transcriptional regulator [Luteitalea sp.]